jgi:hypothetical protein
VLKKISDWLYQVSNSWVALAAVVLFLLFTIFVLPAQAEKSEQQTGSSLSPDTSFTYTPAQLYQAAEVYGERGRQAYIQARFTFDLIFPVVYTVFQVILISWFSDPILKADSRWRLLNLAPFLGALFDYLENISTSLVMARYPASSPVFANLAPIFTMIKWVFVTGSFLILFVWVLGWTWYRVKPSKT